MFFNDYCELPTPHGVFRLYDSGNEFLRILTLGDINNLDENPIVRLHSSCLASEVFAARDCDCADQLKETMKLIAHEGSGIIFHLDQEGRGQGLSNKIRAVYKMQSEGLDTVESFEAMNLAQDIRDYKKAIEVLNWLGVKKVRLVSNNPRKKSALVRAGFVVDILHTHPQIRTENKAYLKSKNEKLGHSLPLNIESSNSGIIYFYHSDHTWGEFSNFSQHAIYLQNKIWPTVEHFYQAQKFSDLNLQEQVRLSATPMLAKQLAKKLEDHHLKNNWICLKESIMWQALVAKFTQHPELKILLLSTKERNIVEYTENDSYWGNNENGSGLNRLGELLMQLRVQIVGKENALCVV